MKLLEIIGLCSLIALSLNIVIPQFIATISGSDRILFLLNDYGEQKLESVLFPVMLILGTWAAIRRIRG